MGCIPISSAILAQRVGTDKKEQDTDPCPKREQCRRDATTAISEFLDKKCTVSDLKLVLLQGLQGYFNDPNYQMPVPGLTSTNTWLVKGIESQNKIGWGELLKGRMAFDFETHQAKSNPNYHRGTNHQTQPH